MTEIVGIDPGSVRIGVAIADRTLRLALPLGTVDARRGFSQAVRAIADLLRERDVSEIVVGLALHMSGEESVASKQARTLGALLQKQLNCRVQYWDERM